MVRLVALAAGWVAGCTILAGLGLRLALGDELRLARYTAYVMPWLLVGLVPGAAWAWRARARALAAVLAAGATMIAVAHLPLVGRRGAVRPGYATTLTVMSFNTWSSNRDAERIARVLLEAAPDLVLLQEIRPSVFEAVAGRLGGLYGGAPVHVAYEPTLQQGAVSRWPLASSIALKARGQAQRVVLRAPAGAITVFNVHAIRERGWRLRHDRVAGLLRDEVLPLETPVILAGDLNAPEHSQLYRLVAAHLENAHRAAGSGFGFTYPAAGLRLLGVPAFPVVRIDHVFFSRHFAALRADALPDSGGSDHRPVLAELALTPGVATAGR
jgi:vancomycin resistance protein VanJ